MPSLFAITTAANSVPLDGNRKGQIVFTVSNTSVSAVRGRARIAPDGAAAATWFKLAGEAEREFTVNATQQYTVQIVVPPTVAAGNYTVRLDMVGVDNPDEDFTQGPSVTFAVPEPLPVKKFPWWIIAVIVGIVIVGVILAVVLSPKQVEVPTLVGSSLVAAQPTLESAGLKANVIQATAESAKVNVVLAQDPSGGAKVQSGSDVTLTVGVAKPITPTPTPTSMPTVTPTPTTMPPTPTPIAVLPQTWQYPMSLVDSRTIYYIRMTAPGQIKVHAAWTGNPSNLAIIINGPGKAGAYARQDGASPLETTYNVTAADLAAGDTWQVTVASFSTGRADGTVQITYPSGSSQSPFEDQFAILNGSGKVVSVLVLKRPGTIEAQAAWTGSPASLAHIINGPGQVGYFARNDGPSPLSVSYTVTADNLAGGDTWRVSLVSFSTPSAEGNISLTYP